MGFHITQPGSSVATSLIDGEAKPKHVLVLEIKVLLLKFSNAFLCLLQINLFCFCCVYDTYAPLHIGKPVQTHKNTFEVGQAL